MSPERAQPSESPGKRTWEKKIRTLEERLEEDLPKQEEQRVVDELEALKTARDFEFNIAALERTLNETENAAQEKNLTLALTLLKEERDRPTLSVGKSPIVEPPAPAAAERGGAGAAEPARVRVVPERVIGPEEGAALRAENIRLDEAGVFGDVPPADEKKEVAKAVDEAAEVVGKNMRGWITRLNDIKIPVPGKEILKNFSTKELVEKLGGKKILGRPALDLLVSAGTGAGVRTTFRYGLGALTGGWGYVLGSAIGAVSGALVDGTLSHHKELERQKGLKDEEFERLLLDVREKKEKLTEKIDQYLEYAHSKDLAEGLPGYKEGLRELLENRLARSAFWKGAFRGACIGAVGGFVGAYLSDWVGTKLGWKIPGAEEAAKAAENLHNNALAEAMAAASADAFNKTNEKLVRAGLAGLDARDFTVVARKGEGATQLARKLISDYINQHQALGDKKFSFNKAQLVYAEDWLQKYIFTNQGLTPQLGESFKFKGEVIRAALADTTYLSPAEIDNLNKNWVWKINEKTWKSIFDFKNVYSADNDFATKIFDEAKRKSAAAGKRAAEELGRAAAMPRPSPVASVATGSWFKASGVKWGLGAIGLGLAGGAIYRYWEPIASTVGRAGRSLTRGAGKAHEFMRTEVDLSRPFRKIAEGGTSVRRMAGALRRQAGEQVKTEITAQPGPIIDVEAQRREAEETQRRETARLEAARTETERVEHEKKLAADPIITLLREGGISIGPEDRFRYELPSKESIAAGKGPSVSFDNYSDFRQYLENLTPKERATTKRFETTIGQGEDVRKYPTLNTFAKKDLWDRIEAIPELNKRFFVLREVALKGLLADEYRDLPEKEDPEKVIGPLIEELKAKFKGEVFYLHKNYTGGVPLEEEIEGLQKLSRVLEEIRGELSYYRVFSFMIGRKGTYLSSGGNCVVEVDPSLSEDQMREYIRGAQSKIVEISDSRQESYNLREAIRKEHGFLLTNASYDKIDVGQEITALKTLQEVLRGFPVDTLKLATGTTILEIGSGEVRKTSAGDVAIYIPPDLSAEETRQYLMSVAGEVELLRSREQK